MRRELIKALVAFSLLGIILGGMYLGVNHMVRERGERAEGALHSYWREKFVPEGDERPTPDPIVIEAPSQPPAPGRIPRLEVLGRFVGENLAALEGARAAAAADGGAAVPLVPEGR